MTLQYHVFGGPGTGKTSFLANEAQKKLNEEGLRPDELGVFTFSRSAADHLKERISKATGLDPKELVGIGTIHGECNRQLHEITHYRDYRLVEDVDIKHFAAAKNFQQPTRLTVFKEGQDWIPTPIEEPDYWNSLATFYTKFPDHKLVDVAGHLNLPIYSELSELQRFQEEWTQYKEENNLIEFYDMPKIVWENEIDVPYLVQFYDEHQDSNPALDKVSKIWMKNALEVYVVGDPYQCLYQYHGCSPYNFMKVGGISKVLDKTHRLAPHMWKLGLEVIKDIPQYYPEQTPISSVRPSEKKAVIRRLEADQVGAAALELIRLNEDALVLARTGLEAGNLAKQVAPTGLVFRSLGSRDYGWPDELMHLTNIWFRLKFGDPLTQPEARAFTLIAHREFTAEGKAMVRKTSFHDVIPLATLQAHSVHQKPLKRIWEGAVKYLRVHRPLQAAALEARKKLGMPVPPKERRKVALGTIHAAKGLEATNVLLYDKISKRLAADVDTMATKREDESRVWFVATTRAIKRLFIISSKSHSFPLPV